MPDPYYFVKRYLSSLKQNLMIAVLILLITSCFSSSPKSTAPPEVMKDNEITDSVIESIKDEKSLGAVSTHDRTVQVEKELVNRTTSRRVPTNEVSAKREYSGGDADVIEENSKSEDVGKTGKETNEKVGDGGKPADDQGTEMQAQSFDHSTWDALLKENVSAAGTVNYQALKSKEDRLDLYLKYLSTRVPGKETPRAEAMAYWINAYNAFTIKLILNNYPVASIMNLHGGKAWDVKWIELAGNSYSLNQIEHDILRKKYPDPRIHFAVNCAAVSCPPLMNRAWTADNLESALERQTSFFINDSKYNQIEESKVRLSKIFEWYKQDFGDLLSFVRTYSKQDVGEKAKVKFNEYDWKLNGK